MKERPILFSGPMVRAILEDRKTKTRRVIKGFDITGPNKPDASIFDVHKDGKWIAAFGLDGHGNFEELCPYGKRDDRLWVRERWGYSGAVSHWKDVPASHDYKDPQTYFLYDANDPAVKDGYKWRSSRFMPKLAARIWLDVLDVKVERVQDITEEDAIAEGVGDWYPSDTFGKGMVCRPGGLNAHVEVFEHLWDSINGKPRKDGVDISWNANPWVWVIEFRRCETKGGE